MSDKILTEQHDGILTVILNNPSKLNCIGFDMLDGLDRALEAASDDESTRLLLIRGAGDRAFSTGADLEEFRSLSDREPSRWIEYGHAVFNKLETLPLPTLAYINGYAVGGGLELALACDFRIGTPSAVLFMPELQHGWLPGWGGMARLRRLVGEAKAKEIVLLCEKIGAERSLHYGLLTRVAESAAELQPLIDHLAGLNSDVFKLAKSVLMDESRSTTGADVMFDVATLKSLR